MFDGINRRVVSLWFPRLASDRVLRVRPVKGPFALTLQENNANRVYCLNEQWAGACATTIFDAEPGECGGAGRNTRLLGVAVSLERALRLAVDFVNWDLAAEGTEWRLSVARG